MLLSAFPQSQRIPGRREPFASFTLLTPVAIFSALALAGWDRFEGRIPWPRPLGSALLVAGLVVVDLGMSRLRTRAPETLALFALLSVGVAAAFAALYGKATRSDAAPEAGGSSPGPVREAPRGLVVIALLVVVSGTAWLLFNHREYLHSLAATYPLGELVAFMLMLAGAGGAAWVVRRRRSAPPTPRARRALVLGAVLVALALVAIGGSSLAADEGRAEAALGSNLLRRWKALARGITSGSQRAVAAEGVRGCRANESLGAPGEQGRVAPGAPDILFITIDGVRWDHTSLDPDSEHSHTPLLAARAGEGYVFERAYSPAPSTRQTFRSVFTGLLPGQIAAPHESSLPWALTFIPEQPTLAEYLSEGGYRTIAYLSKDKAFPPSLGALRGFAEVEDRLVPFQRQRGYSAQWIISAIIGRLAEPPGPEVAPRFVWTHLIEPHFPYTYGPHREPPPDEPGLEAKHGRSIRYIDEQLDRLLEFASQPERRERTLVVISADHGEAFGEHRNRRHGETVYEEEIHVPLVFFGSGVEPGRSAEPVSLVSALATFADVAGLRPIDGICGRSLWPAVSEAGALAPAPVYAAALPDPTMDFHQRAFFSEGVKWLVDGETGEGRLYVLAEDPDERAPVTEGDAVAQARARYRAFVEAHALP